MGRRWRRFSFALLLVLLVCLAGIMPRHQAAAGEFKGAPSPPAKKVLLLYSYQAMLPANLEWDEDIRKGLKGTECANDRNLHGIP